MSKKLWFTILGAARYLVLGALFALTIGFLFGGLAFAQDAGPGPFNPADPVAGIGTAIDALVHGNWWLLASFGNTIAVWLLRKYALPKYAENKWVGWGLNLGLNLLTLAIPFLAAGGLSFGGVKAFLLAWLRDAATSGLLWHFASDTKLVKKIEAS